VFQVFLIALDGREPVFGLVQAGGQLVGRAVESGRKPPVRGQSGLEIFDPLRIVVPVLG
jgi:hypothetical protein